MLENIRESDAYFFQTSPAFPREIMCTYAKVSVHSITKQKVQCILPFNSYLEQIMVVIWWWMTFLIALTIYDGFFFTILELFDRIPGVGKHF